MREEVKKRAGKATYFFKTAARGSRDVNYDPDDTFLQYQYYELRHSGFEIGLHPSYHAYNHARYLREEHDVLKRISGAGVTSIRTHYLRFDPVLTPNILAENGFSVDSSLGFSHHEGFRRGTCLPFPLFDVSDDRELSLWEMPLTVMDSTLFTHRSLSLGKAVSESVALMDTCKHHHGVFVGLWHNILWDEQERPGLGDHFISCLDQAKNEKAKITSLRSAFESWK